jgi:hypothetical protein
LLERQWLKKSDSSRGSFRGFLLSLLRNFLANRRRLSMAKRRGGGATIVPLDGIDGERELAGLAQAELGRLGPANDR